MQFNLLNDKISKNVSVACWNYLWWIIVRNPKKTRWLFKSIDKSHRNKIKLNEYKPWKLVESFHFSATMKTISLAFLVVCVAFSSAGTRSVLESRVTNGKDAAPGQFPYQISLRLRRNNLHRCGGSIISNRFVLTAAHCTRDYLFPSLWWVIVGALKLDNDGIKHTVDRVMPHEEYSKAEEINDITLLRTSQEIVFSETTRPIALPKQNIPEEASVHAILSGWGKTRVSLY